jgi:hypothetical protein
MSNNPDMADIGNRAIRIIFGGYASIGRSGENSQQLVGSRENLDSNTVVPARL